MLASNLRVLEGAVGGPPGRSPHANWRWDESATRWRGPKASAMMPPH
jgi:hypothetical protein